LTDMVRARGGWS